ncbi:MAG: hypothetical protein WCI73_14500, partial [Phycisphaerae bacterium]
VSAAETPDFILNTGQISIGIEVRDVYKEFKDQPTTMRAQENIYDRIVEAAHNLYRAAGRPAITANFGFHKDTTYRQRDINEYALQLVKCIPNSFASSMECEYLHHVAPKADWLCGLDYVQGRVRLPYEPEEGRWDARQGGAVLQSEPFMQMALDDKERKFDDYRKGGCDELWLLLVIQNLNVSGFMRKPNPTHTFRSSFERVFAMWQFETEVIELPVHKP